MRARELVGFGNVRCTIPDQLGSSIPILWPELRQPRRTVGGAVRGVLRPRGMRGRDGRAQIVHEQGSGEEEDQVEKAVLVFESEGDVVEVRAGREHGGGQVGG